MEKEKNESPEQYFCGYCKLSLPCLQELKDHLSSHKNDSEKVQPEGKTNKLAKWNLCEKVLSSQNKLTRHLTFVHEKRKDFSCDICDRKFSQTSHLNNHKLRLHQDEHHIKLLECSTCKKTFKLKKYYKLHECVISGSKQYKCSLCEMKFISSCYIRQHMNRVHKPDEEKYLFNCEICSKTYSSKSNLQIYTERVHGKRSKYICNQCGKDCRSKSVLGWVHLKIA